MKENTDTINQVCSLCTARCIYCRYIGMFLISLLHSRYLGCRYRATPCLTTAAILCCLGLTARATSKLLFLEISACVSSTLFT